MAHIEFIFAKQSPNCTTDQNIKKNICCIGAISIYKPIKQTPFPFV